MGPLYERRCVFQLHFCLKVWFKHYGPLNSDLDNIDAIKHFREFPFFDFLYIATGPTHCRWGHPFHRSWSHLEEADGTGTPSTLTDFLIFLCWFCLHCLFESKLNA